ncbi:transposase for transposon [Streptomyces himastatinicus ATCC 53653]|uniref:Transposase for transposon n=1 Tax=Streptomyces himastatinicus ATCC 53653 TaxID=457427 RepID=D9WKN3_9ACTN|nr:transposase for transposon [Streptomyces himastatinicus ATCC 53653]
MAADKADRACLAEPAQGGGQASGRAAGGHLPGGRARAPDNAQIAFDDDGRLHFAVPEPEPEPASLPELRAAVNTMLPRVNLPEELLEVFSWTGADPGQARGRRPVRLLAQRAVCGARRLVPHQFC